MYTSNASLSKPSFLALTKSFLSFKSGSTVRPPVLLHLKLWKRLLLNNTQKKFICQIDNILSVGTKVLQTVAYMWSISNAVTSPSNVSTFAFFCFRSVPHHINNRVSSVCRWKMVQLRNVTINLFCPYEKPKLTAYILVLLTHISIYRRLHRLYIYHQSHSLDECLLPIISNGRRSKREREDEDKQGRANDQKKKRKRRTTRNRFPRKSASAKLCLQCNTHIYTKTHTSSISAVHVSNVSIASLKPVNLPWTLVPM